MRRSTAYKMGYEDGLDHARYCTLSEDEYRKLQREDKLGEMLGDIVDGYRQFSPFEFKAKAFNDAANSEALWEAYDKGEWRGWIAGLRIRFTAVKQRTERR